jgi:hypothetical protein
LSLVAPWTGIDRRDGAQNGRRRITWLDIHSQEVLSVDNKPDNAVEREVTWTIEGSAFVLISSRGFTVHLGIIDDGS